MSFNQALFSFRGRIGRLAFLGYGLLSFAGCVVLIAIAHDLTVDVGGGDWPDQARLYSVILTVIALAAAFWMQLALTVKRLHDLGLSGWAILWFYLLEVIMAALRIRDPSRDAFLALVYLGAELLLMSYAIGLLFVRGQANENRFGVPPANRKQRLPA